MKKRILAFAASLAIVFTLLPAPVRADNPFLPLWERIPDGEPHIFKDPDTGEERVYLYGSHDTFHPDGFGYCGQDHVVWSAPVGDLEDWRHEGVSFEMTQLEGLPYIDEETGEEKILSLDMEKHVLYAPDVVYNPGTGRYYLYTFIAAGKPSSLIFMASSESPAGPFTDPIFVTTGFDPAVLVDDALDEEGNPRVYLYYSREATRDLFACELDSGDMCTILEGSLHYPDTYAQEEPELSTMLSKSYKPFCFFEGPSIRKVEGWYLLSYARSEPIQNNGNGKLSEIGWCYSDNPYGDPALGEPWTYGGVIVSNKGSVIDNPYYEEESQAAEAFNAQRGEKEKERKVDAQYYTYVGNNNHGGMVQIGEQWYQVYHRDTNLNSKRQAMIEPITLSFDEEGRPVIEEVEMTSQGILSQGMDPFSWHYAQSACYVTPQTRTNGKPNAAHMVTNPEGNFDPEAEHGDWYPVAGIKDKTWLGYKYFDFGEGLSQDLSLCLEMICEENTSLKVYCSLPWEEAQQEAPQKTLIGSASLSKGEGVQEVLVPVDGTALLGKMAIYLEVRSDAYEEETALEVAQINRLRFQAGQ